VNRITVQESLEQFNSILKNILRRKSSQESQSISLCNDSVIVAMIYETYNDSMNRYNVSGQSDLTAIFSKTL
jgi:hypothetical protein